MNPSEYYKYTSLKNIKGELWKPFPLSDFYECSNMDRIKAIGRFITHKTGVILFLKEKIMRQGVNKKGYCQLMLRNNKGTFYQAVHRAVAITWIPNTENKAEVNHTKGIKTDNRHTELEWSTHPENMEHAGKFNLMRKGKTHYSYGKILSRGKDNPLSKPVNQYLLNGLFIKKWDALADIERVGKISKIGVQACCVLRQKMAYGFQWKYWTSENDRKNIGAYKLPKNTKISLLTKVD